jgi:hypothetical protein
MTPTPEATGRVTPVDALAVALYLVTQEPPDLDWEACADAILAALPPGTVLTTVDDVARRLHEHCNNPETAAWAKERGFTYGHDPEAHTAEAARLLGVTE